MADSSVSRGLGVVPAAGRSSRSEKRDDGALHRTQGLAMARLGLDLGDLVAQVAHPLGQSGVAGFGLGAGNLGLDLIEQSHQLASQVLPFAGIGLLIVRVGADH